MASNTSPKIIANPILKTNSKPIFTTSISEHSFPLKKMGVKDWHHWILIVTQASVPYICAIPEKKKSALHVFTLHPSLSPFNPILGTYQRYK
jgi:hypothetical protein